MDSNSPIYQAAFRRYLRSGISIDTQLAIGEQKAFAAFQRGAIHLAKSLLTERIVELEQKFIANGRKFLQKQPLNISALERSFVTRYIATHAALSTKEAPEKERLAAYSFLQDWFAQKIDPVIQPYYGVASFMWVSNSANPCANCAGNEGRIFRWDEGIAPPGCGHCQCSAEPVFEQGEEADDSQQPSERELLSVSWRLNYINKSDIKWMNRLKDRGWTKAKITNTIRYGTAHPAKNNLREENGATEYRLDGQYIVIDNTTREILQTSGVGFRNNK